MNTYFLAEDPERTARYLDARRLGKQRNEAVQIARFAGGLTEKQGWRGHPIVAAWRPYLGYLAHRYLTAVTAEWVRRGYHNEKVGRSVAALQEAIPCGTQRPRWVTAELIRPHRAYLVRRAPDIYAAYWPDVDPATPLIWPREAAGGETRTPGDGR